MEPLGDGCAVRELSIRILDLGHNQQSEESVPGAGEWWLVRPQIFPTIAMADCGKPEDHQVGEWRDDLRGWVV